MKSSPYFIVVYDDNECLYIPHGWDADCAGAIAGTGRPVVLFKTRFEARRAILISERFAKLQSARGKPFNDDFTSGKKNVKIVPCVEALPASAA